MGMHICDMHMCMCDMCMHMDMGPMPHGHEKMRAPCTVHMRVFWALKPFYLVPYIKPIHGLTLTHRSPRT